MWNSLMFVSQNITEQAESPLNSRIWGSNTKTNFCKATYILKFWCAVGENSLPHWEYGHLTEA